MLRLYRRGSKRNRATTRIAASVIALTSSGISTLVHAGDSATQTPIKHLIVLIGENWSFDSVFATYRPKQGQTIANLLSKGIILKSGQPGPHFKLSQQYQINTPFPATYFIDASLTPGDGLPAISAHAHIPCTEYRLCAALAGGLDQGQGPFDKTLVPDSLLPTIEPSLEKSDLFLLRTGASGLPMFTNDTRVTNATTLPNGVFEITGATLPYDSYTGDMVHRLFHMWQQSDCNVKNAPVDGSNPVGCLKDLYPFVGVARKDGSGSNAMGFFNMRKGDAPVFKKIADKYTINDNYHQPVMGGTAVQHIMIGTANAIPWDTFPGSYPTADS
jgi:phospholipase C